MFCCASAPLQGGEGTLTKNCLQASVVEECINLWTRMMLADAEHDKKVDSNVRQCMQRAQEKAQRLKEDLVPAKR